MRMTETRKLPAALPLQARNLEAVAIDEVRDDRTITLSASSEAPVDRGFWVEVLDHTPGAVDLSRLEGSAVPLLFNHDWSDPIGMVSTGHLDGGRLHVAATLFETARADEVRAMIRGGLRNVSIGYSIDEVRERDNDFLVTRWALHEVSVAPVPADAGIGIGRSIGTKEFPLRVERALPETATAVPLSEKSMSEKDTAPAAETADTKIEITEERHDPVKHDQRRSEAIVKLGEANNIDPKTVRHWITNGTDFDAIANDILNIHEERGKSANSPAMIGMTQKEVGQYSVLRAITAAKSNNWKGAGLELEAHRAMMDRDNLQPHSDKSVFVPMDVQTRKPTYGQRVFTAGVAGAAGGVGTDHLASSFIDLLYNQSVAMAMGSTRLTGLRGNVQIPKLATGGTAYWLATETTAITQSTPTMSKVSLTPKNVAGLVEVSHQMAQQGDPSVEQMVLGDLSTVVALAMDAAALDGDGTGGAPIGIANTPGIGTFDGTSLDYDAIVGAEADLLSANALNVGNLGWAVDPATAAKLKTRVKFPSTASPIWDSGNIQSGTVDGIRAMASNQMADDSALLGAWASLIIAEWGTLELAVDENFNFATGSIGLRAWYSIDVGVRYPGAFSLGTSIT